MPLALKRNLNNPLSCPSCTQIFQTRGGLSQHYHRKHRTVSKSLAELCKTGLDDNDANPLLEPIGVPPDISQIICSQVIAESSSPELETTGVSVSSIVSHENFSISKDSDFYTDSDTNTEISDLDTPVDIHVGLIKLPEISKLGNILPHPDASHIYDTPGQDSHSLEIQKQDHMRLNHPYHPWASENE